MVHYLHDRRQNQVLLDLDQLLVLRERRAPDPELSALCLVYLEVLDHPIGNEHLVQPRDHPPQDRCPDPEILFNEIKKK